MAQDTSPFESQVRRGAFVAGDAGHLLALKSKMRDPDLDPVQTMLSMGGDHLGLVEKWRASHLQSTSTPLPRLSPASTNIMSYIGPSAERIWSTRWTTVA